MKLFVFAIILLTISTPIYALYDRDVYYPVGGTGGTTTIIENNITNNITTYINTTIENNITVYVNTTNNITNNITETNNIVNNITNNYTVNVTTDFTIINAPENNLSVNLTYFNNVYLLKSIYLADNVTIWANFLNYYNITQISQYFYNKTETDALLDLKLNVTDQRYNDTAYFNANIDGNNSQIAYFTGTNTISSSAYANISIDNGAEVTLSDGIQNSVRIFGGGASGSGFDIRSDVGTFYPSVYLRDTTSSPFVSWRLSDTAVLFTSTGGVPFKFSEDIWEQGTTLSEKYYPRYTNPEQFVNVNNLTDGSFDLQVETLNVSGKSYLYDDTRIYGVLNTSNINQFQGETKQQGILNMSNYITGGTQTAGYPVRLDLQAVGGYGWVRYTFPTGAINTIAEVSVLGTLDLFHQLIPNASGYAYFEGYGGKGVVLGTGNGNLPILFRINRVTKASLDNTRFNISVGVYGTDFNASAYNGSVVLLSKNITINGTDNPLRLIDSSTVFNDLVVPLSSVKIPSANAPPFSETYRTYYFQNAVSANEQQVFLGFQLPHWYKEGTNIECHIHVLPSNTEKLNVTFSLNYTWTNYLAVEGASTGIQKNLNFTSGVAFNHSILSFGNITGTGKTISSSFKATLRRLSGSASDSFTGDAYVDFFDCHVEQDTLGSASQYGKWS